MSEEILIHSVENGKSRKVNDMLSEFDSFNQDHTLFNPNVKFSDDCLIGKNNVSFLVKIRDVQPVAIFETMFPKNATDPVYTVNSIINYMNEFKKQPNQFLLNIGGTNEKKRKEKFGGNAHGLSDISKMFTKQPISKKKPVLVISPEMDVDVKHLANIFPSNRFSFKIEQGSSDEISSLEKEMIAAGFEKEPEIEQDYSLL